MRIAVTGGTGFIGRYIIARLAAAGHECLCWQRPTSDTSGFERHAQAIRWIAGDLGDADACRRLVENCDACVHAALHRQGPLFRGGEGEITAFAEKNIVGTLQLIEAARQAGVKRFIFLSTCAVHEKILDDRPLDETHPPWPFSHYGAHKAAIEMFVHSYGLGCGYEICALRPCGVYGINHQPQNSKWYDLVAAVVRGEEAHCDRGGKEVHAADVARAVEILLAAPHIAGEAYNCCDMYVSQYDVAHIACELSGSKSPITGTQTRPQHEIVTQKLVALGMRFGGEALLRETIGRMIEAVKAT